MSRAPWLIIPVEVKHREFHSRIVLARLAVERGFRVLLGRDTVVRRLAPYLPKGIIFDKSLGTARHGKPQRFSRLGHKVVVHDEESTGFYGSPDQFLGVRLAPETLSVCTRWYCISDQLRDHAIARYPDFEDRFLTSGLLRTDVWRQQFSGFYASDTEQIRTEQGPFILFNSNFGGLLHARGEEFARRQIRRQKSAYAAVEEHSEKIFREARANLDAFLEMLPRLLEWFPDHRLVIRPHPSEQISYWQDKFSGNNRITVTNSKVATPWIAASDILVHHGCTTGIEAEILGKPHVMYAPHPDAHHDTPVMQTFAPIAKTEAALRKAMGSGIGKPGKAQSSLARRENWFANLGKRMVADHILDDLQSIAFDGSPLSPWLPILRAHPRILTARWKLRSQRDKSYSKQKWPGSSTEEISQLLAIAGETIAPGNLPPVREVFPELWQIGN